MPRVNIPVDTLIQQFHGSDWTARCDAALSLPWYDDKRFLEPLRMLTSDPDEIVCTAATLAVSALQKTISYRNQPGM